MRIVRSERGRRVVMAIVCLLWARPQQMQQRPRSAGSVVFSPLVGLAEQRSESRYCADERRRVRPRSAADTFYWLELPMATIQHSSQRTVIGNIEPGVKPRAGLTAPFVRATGRG